MDAIGTIAGESDELLWEHEWPAKDALSDYSVPDGAVAARGNVRLAARLVIDRIEVRDDWQRIVSALLKAL